MNSKPVKIPGPDHPITVKVSGEHVVVKVADKVIADSRKALLLQEASYPPVYYLPRGDVEMALLRRSSHQTYCPYKGECSYYSIAIGGNRSADAVWSYETPYEAVAEIRDYLAFYPNRVDSIAVG